ncbi:MAG: TIGR01777 family oxidoreductase, partial [Methylococcales bacterium]
PLMKILITGGTGLIGKKLCSALLQKGHDLTVLSRRPAFVPNGCKAIASLNEWQPEIIYDAVINLAGEPIVDKAWTDKRKKCLWDSRVTLTEELVKHIEIAYQKPKVLISGSAIGYYGNTGDAVIDESSATGSDFGATLCSSWENAALKSSIRVCILRTSLVLDSSGGFLKKMLLPFKFGLGGQIGDGKQWMSWIHIDDYIAIVIKLLDDTGAKGVYNMAAPEPVTNAQFTKILATIFSRPAFFTVPTCFLKLLLNERAVLILGGQRVSSVKIHALDYAFVYPNLENAIRSLYPVKISVN